MKKSDIQLGKPSILYKGTTAELDALSAVEGMQAYDTTLDKFVYYDGSNWVESAKESHTHVEDDITDLDHTDATAIHDNVSGEISAITEKTSLADADIVLIEDSAATNAKKKSKISTFLAKARSILFLNEITTPSTPPSGQVSLYAKADGLPFVKNDAGVESPIALGGVWQDWTPTWTASTTNPSVGNGTLSGRYCTVGKLLNANIYVVFGSTTTAGSGAYSFTYPVAPSNYRFVNGIYRLRDVGGKLYGGSVEPFASTFALIRDGGTYVTNATPFGFANQDIIGIGLSYEIA